MRKILFIAIITITVIFFLSNSNLSMAYEKEIKSISSTLAENIAKAGKKMIAVVDFTDLQGNVTELGRFLAEEFSVVFSGAGKGFEVVDRTHLKSILVEHKLSATGIIDPQTARKLGQIAGVDALVTGTITPFGDSVRLSVKILETSTAKVIGASSGDIAKTKAIEELLARGIETRVPSGQTTASTSSKPQPKPEHKVEVNDFIFEARRCRREGERVICTITVTNNLQEIRLFQVMKKPGESLLVDDFGNEYNAETLSFGGSAVVRDIAWDTIVKTLPYNVPMNIVYSYRGIRADAKSVIVIIPISPYERGAKAVLRNIPLTR